MNKNVYHMDSGGAFSLHDSWDSISSGMVFSFAKKKEHNFEIVRKILSICDSGGVLSPQDFEEMREYADLYNGRWEGLATLDNSSYSKSVTLESGETYTFGRNSIDHHPYLDGIVQQIHERIVNMGLVTYIKDYGKYANEFKKEQTNQLIKDELVKRYIQPAVMSAIQKYDMQNPINDANDEQSMGQRDAEVQKIQSDVMNERVKALLDEISTPTEDLYNLVMSITMIRSKLEDKFEEGARYAVAMARQAYIPRHYENEVMWETVNVLNANYRLSSKSPYFEDGLMFRYEQILSPVEIIGDIYEYLSDKSYKDVDKLLTAMPENPRMYGANHQGRFMGTIPFGDVPYMTNDLGSIDEATMEYNPARYQTKDGIEYNPNLMEYINSAYTNRNLGVSVVDYFWRWTAVAHEVHRMEGDKIKKYRRGEDYKKSPNDLRVVKIMEPETWQAKCIGGTYYADMRATPYQKLSPSNDEISIPKLGVYGGEMQNYFGNEVKMSTVMGPAKKYQLEYNIISTSISDLVKDNIGQVLMINQETIDNFGIQGFYDLLYKMNTVIYKPGGARGDDGSGVRTLDMTRKLQLDQYMSLLGHYRSMMEMSTRLNPGELGQAGQYTTSENLRSSKTATNRGLNHYYSMTAKIRNNVIEAATKMNVYKYKENTFIKENYFPAALKMHMENNFEELVGSPVHFITPNNSEIKSNIDLFKQTLLQFSANSGDFEAVASTIDIRDYQDVKNIIKKIKRDRNADKQQEHSMRMAEMQEQNKGILEAQKMKEENLLIMKREDLGVRRESSYLNSMQLAFAGDLNRNGQADFVENAKEQRAADQIENDLDRKNKIEIEKIKQSGKN